MNAFTNTTGVNSAKGLFQQVIQAFIKEQPEKCLGIFFPAKPFSAETAISAVKVLLVSPTQTDKHKTRLNKAMSPAKG